MKEPVVRINKNTEVIISPEPGESLETPIYAINWFNLNRPWLYNLYSKVAYPHVVKVGGKVLLKAVVTDQLVSEPVFNRTNLLIVRYPSAQAFLSMLSSKLFLLKSILRIKSVKDFIFGFTKRIDEGEEPGSLVNPYPGKSKYMVHVFTTGNKPEISQLIPSVGSISNLQVFYYGITVARIGRRDINGTNTPGPFPVDGIIVWEAGEVSEFQQLMATPTYQEFQNSNQTNGIYLLKRIL